MFVYNFLLMSISVLTFIGKEHTRPRICNGFQAKVIRCKKIGVINWYRILSLNHSEFELHKQTLWLKLFKISITSIWPSTSHWPWSLLVSESFHYRMWRNSMPVRLSQECNKHSENGLSINGPVSCK